MTDLIWLIISIVLALTTKLVVAFSDGLSPMDEMYLTGVNHGAVLWAMAGIFKMGWPLRNRNQHND